jgi:hypothetical protein
VCSSDLEEKKRKEKLAEEKALLDTLFKAIPK